MNPINFDPSRMYPVIISVTVAYAIISFSMIVLSYLLRKITTKEQKQFLYLIIATIMIGGTSNVTKVCLLMHGYYSVDTYIDLANMVIASFTAIVSVCFSFKAIKLYINNKQLFNEKMKDVLSLLGVLQRILDKKPKK